MAAASAPFAAGSPRRVTVHQWPAGQPLPGWPGVSPGAAPLASPLPRQAPRRSASPPGRGGGGGGGGGLLRHDSLGGAASEEPLLITTTPPAATAQMREAMLWPSLPVAAAAAGGLPLPGLGPLGSLPLGPAGLPPTPLVHIGQLSPPPAQLGAAFGLGGMLSPPRLLGALGALSLPGSGAATPQGSHGRLGSPGRLPPIPSYGELGQPPAKLRRTSSSSEGLGTQGPGAAALSAFASIQAHLDALNSPGEPGQASADLSNGRANGSAGAAASQAHAALLAHLPPLPPGSGGYSLPASAFPGFAAGSAISGTMLQAASAVAAASHSSAAATTAAASQPAASPAAVGAAGGQGGTPPASSGLPAFGAHGGGSPGRWWLQQSPARSEGQQPDWLATSLPLAEAGGSLFLGSQ